MSRTKLIWGNLLLMGKGEEKGQREGWKGEKNRNIHHTEETKTGRQADQARRPD